MKSRIALLLCPLLMLPGCAMTQKPVAVSDTVSADTAPAPVGYVEPVPAPRRSSPPVVHGAPSVQVAPASVSADALSLDKLPRLARTRQKNPAGLKAYLGRTLHGQGKFVKTAKGNPNAMVADVRVSGIGEVSIWCRNVLGVAMPTTGKATGFEGILTGEVYTSEDFSNDVYLKDCRFRD